MFCLCCGREMGPTEKGCKAGHGGANLQSQYWAQVRQEDSNSKHQQIFLKSLKINIY